MWGALLVLGSVLLAACDANVSLLPEDAASASPSAGEGEPAAGLGAPTSFEAEANPFVIRLRWIPPIGEVEEYNLYRDGNLVRTVGGTETSFTDDTVSPGKRYEYEIEAVSGDATSTRASVGAKTPTPALRQARLEGVFNVKVKEQSSYGYERNPGRVTMGWEFKPSCKSGPCKVRWQDTTYKGLKSTLTRKGRSYRGSDSATLNVRCGSTVTVSQVEVNFRVTKARAIGDEWRAIRFTGTMKRSEASQLGCVSSGGTYSISGKLLSA